MLSCKTLCSCGKHEDRALLQADIRIFRYSLFASYPLYPSRILHSDLKTSQTLASAPPDPLEDKLRADEWVSAGGSSADDVVAPSALYFTAILE